MADPLADAEPERPVRRRRRRRARRSRAGVRNYPATVAEILDDAMRFNRDAVAAVRAFARSKPWRGTASTRKAKLLGLRDALAEAYGMAKPKMRFERITGACSGSSSYNTATNVITIRGKLSVVTFLHEFRHAMGGDERQATKWSVNLFRRCFPLSYGRCDHEAHTLRRRHTVYTKEA